MPRRPTTRRCRGHRVRGGPAEEEAVPGSSGDDWSEESARTASRVHPHQVDKAPTHERHPWHATDTRLGCHLLSRRVDPPLAATIAAPETGSTGAT